ncbi:unnamed protein product [Citrullus colocynthis]|uniref:Uncharacterized protein n=1 Tax=Citrullus colocynthis TaxID=252529 RepID=A0ABP0Y6N2_9ROSI
MKNDIVELFLLQHSHLARNATKRIRQMRDDSRITKVTSNGTPTRYQISVLWILSYSLSASQFKVAWFRLLEFDCLSQCYLKAFAVPKQ